MQPVISWKNKQLLINQSHLLNLKLEETYLTADIAAASGTLTVANINRFAINQNLIINPFGETAEFVKTHASTTPSGSTITLAANTSFAHYIGEKVFLVPFNQIELANATTLTGTKTVLITSVLNGLVALEADNPVLVYPEPEYNSGYYFGRYVNNIGATWTVVAATDVITSTAHGLVAGDTIKVIAGTTLPAGASTTVVYYVITVTTNTFQISLTNGGSSIDMTDTGTGTLTWYKCSLYSDGVQYGTWDRSSAGFMIERALRDLELQFSDKLTAQDCYEWTNDGLKLVQGKLKRWPEHYSYNAVLGQASRGTNILAMPTDAYDTETNKSLIALRIGTRGNLDYLDPVWFDAQMSGVKRTQVTTQATSGQTTLAINNSYDFADSGSVNIYVSGTKYSITYTGVTRSATAGVLTGVPASGTGSISVTIAVDTYVWQDENEGIPTNFTVRNGNIEFYPLVNGNEDNANIYGDYSKVITMVDSDGDVIDLQRYDMVSDYLKWRMKMKAKNDGILDYKDGFYFAFKEKLNDAIRTLPQNNRFPMRPRLNTMKKHPSFRQKANLQDLSFDQQ